MAGSWNPDERSTVSREILREGGQLLGRLDELLPFLYIAQRYSPSPGDIQEQETNPLKGFFTLATRTDRDRFEVVPYHGLILPVRLCRDNKVRTALEEIPALAESRQITLSDRRRLVRSKLDEAFHGDLQIADNDSPEGFFALKSAPEFFRRGYGSFDYVREVLDNPAGTVRMTKTSRLHWRSLGELVEWYDYLYGARAPSFGTRFTSYFVSDNTEALLDRYIESRVRRTFCRGWGGGLNRPAANPSKWFMIRPGLTDAKLSIRLEMRQGGWIRLHLSLDETTATIQLSEVFDPFQSMVAWGREIDEGDLPIRLIIDEEGRDAELVVLCTDDPARVLLRVTREDEDDVLLEGIVARTDLAASFKAELRRFFTEEFEPDEWPDYSNHGGILREYMLNNPWMALNKEKLRRKTPLSRLESEEEASFVPVLTVMADYGCAPFLWLVDCPEDRGVGRNVCDGMYWDESFPITEELWRKFADWAREFDRTPLFRVDFDAHNVRGRQLTRWLKEEVGEKYRVVYVNSFEQPGRRYWGDRTEFLADGDCLPRRRLYAYRPRSKPFHFCRYILSSGQTGAERAALDFAIRHGYSHGGWALPGREAADGVIVSKYQLIELPEGGSRQCIRRNMGYSDGMLIVNLCEMGRSTQVAQAMAESEYVGYKTKLIVQLDPGVTPDAVDSVLKWLHEWSINTLYITGPQESERPGIYGLTMELLEAVDAVFRPESDSRISERDPPIPKSTDLGG